MKTYEEVVSSLDFDETELDYLLKNQTHAEEFLERYLAPFSFVYKIEHLQLAFEAYLKQSDYSELDYLGKLAQIKYLWETL